MPAREELDVGPANDGRAHAEDDFARPGARCHQIALLVFADRRLNESHHDDRPRPVILYRPRPVILTTAPALSF
jgi:hypothetical protein